MFPLFYGDDCIMFSPFEDKIIEPYDSLQADFKIEDNGKINKYLGI